MKWDWSSQLFKPNLLFISKSGVVWVEHYQQSYEIFKTTSDFCRFMKESGQSTHPLRVLLDAVDHRHFFEKKSRDAFWQSHWMVRRQIKNRFNYDSYIFLDTHKDSYSGFVISLQESIQKWMTILIELQVPVEGIYGLPYEIGRASTTSQLMIIPTSHQETHV